MKHVDLRMEKNAYRELDTLHVSVSRLCENFILSGLNIVDDGLLDDGDLEIETLSIEGGREGTGKLVELDGVVADVN